MDHRATSLKFLASTGIFPVKVLPQQKNPDPGFNPRAMSGANHKDTLRQIENNPDLNLGGLFCGKYVDIDIDSNMPALRAAVEIFMPKTPWIWGRKTNPRSHWAYSLDADFDRDPYSRLLNFMKSSVKIGTPTPGWTKDKGPDPAVDNYSVEFRGGKVDNGFMTVLPGSYRGDIDEWVEWEDELDFSVSSAHAPAMYLIKMLRMAQATALMATYFTEGVRNDMSLAITGLLWRIRSSSLVACGAEHESDMPEDVFCLSEDDASDIYKAILAISDPNSKDRRSRELNFSSTWNKLNNNPDAKVTGGKRLAELIGEQGQKVVKAIYRLLSDNDGIEALEALAEQYVIWYGPGVAIDLVQVDRGSKKCWMTDVQAKNSMGNQKIMIGEKKTPIATFLFNSTAVRRVEGFTFDPSTQERICMQPGFERPHVNQWRGFAVEPCSQSVTNEEVRPFLEYVFEVLANGSQDAADWILAWCSDMFQKPAEKPGTCLVLVGPQGAGKTFLGEQILGKIIGPAHYTQMNSINGLTDKFNTIAENKIFIQCDEAVHSYQKDVASKLKSIITDEGITVEPKGIDSYRIPNHIHFLFTSNETNNPIFIDPTPNERRFTVCKVSASRTTDMKYWTFMREWAKMNLGKLLRWFMSYRYDKELIRRPIHTAAKQQIQRLGVDPEVSWIISRVSQGFPIGERAHEHWWTAFNSETVTEPDKLHDTLRRDSWPDRVYIPALETDFRTYVRDHGRSVYSGSVLSIIRTVLPDDSMVQGGQVTVLHSDPRTGQSVRSRIRNHSFPSKELIMAHLRVKYGNIVDKLLDDSQNDELEEIVQASTEEAY